MDIETKMEAVAAMQADEIEEMLADCPEMGIGPGGLPLDVRKQMVELMVRRYEYFYDLGAKSGALNPAIHTKEGEMR